MRVHVVMAVCNQPDTRVDHNAEIKEIVCVLKAKPSDKQKKELLAKKMEEDDIEPEDRKLYWIETVETLLS